MMSVTTRFRLKHVWSLPSMYLAYRRVRPDLVRAPGLVRFAFLVENPLACYTLSVWESETALNRFANTRSHVVAVRHAKRVCREIWSAYWRIDAVSAYARRWSGGREWPALVPAPSQPWHLVPADTDDGASNGVKPMPHGGSASNAEVRST